MALGSNLVRNGSSISEAAGLEHSSHYPHVSKPVEDLAMELPLQRFLNEFMPSLLQIQSLRIAIGRYTTISDTPR